MQKRQVPIRDVEIGQHVRIETVSRDTLMPVTYCGTVERKIIGTQFRSTQYVRLWIDDPRSGHVETIKRHTDEITVLCDDADVWRKTSEILADKSGTTPAGIASTDGETIYVTTDDESEHGRVEMAWLMFVTVALLCALYLPYALMIAAKFGAANKALGQ